MAVTTNYSWTLPTVGADATTWGGILNTTTIAIDAQMFLAAPKASPTFTGTVSGVTGSFSGTMTANAFAGPLTGAVTGNVTGNVTGSSGSCTGLSATATALATGRTISLTGDATATTGAFDGTAAATAALTLATVNGNVGTFANPSSVTVNAKGLITAVAAGTAPVNVTAAHFTYQLASGTGPSETLTANTWIQRKINTTVSNGISGASLAANQITLAAGTYTIAASFSIGSGGSNGDCTSRLRNITDSTTVLVGGLVEVNAGSPYAQSTLGGVFVLGGSKTLEIDTQSKGNAAVGGAAASTGEVEVYGSVVITKIA